MTVRGSLKESPLAGTSLVACLFTNVYDSWPAALWVRACRPIRGGYTGLNAAPHVIYVYSSCT